MEQFKEISNFVRARKYDKALKALLDSKTLKLNKQFKSDANHAWYVVGDIYFKKKCYKESIKAFRKSLRSRRDDYQAQWAIGEIYSEINRPKIAERYFRKALALQPDNKALIYNLGNSLFDQKKFRAAIKEYKRINENDGALFRKAMKNIEVAQKLID